MSLSVCCPTADPGPRVHAILEPLRSVADEIIVASDARTSVEDLGWYAAVADRVFTFEFSYVVEQVYGWLHAQCSCDWILLIEGDELASPGLIERLRALTRQRAVNQFYLPRRWLYPDPDHWLDEAPWWPDLSNRLVRNDGALYFAGQAHSEAMRVDPAGFVDEPLYHLAALEPLEKRRAKIERYSRTTAGLRIGGVRPVSETYYVPEQTSRRVPEPVPEQDLAAVHAVVSGSPGPAPAPAADVPHIPPSVTNRYYAGRAFSNDGYRCRLEPFERDLSVAPGELRGVLVMLTNVGDEIWPWGLERPPHLHLSYQHWQPGPATWVDSDVITPLPHTFEPGQSALVPVTVIAPEEPGRHRLRLDMRHAGHRWFGCPLEIELSVS